MDTKCLQINFIVDETVSRITKSLKALVKAPKKKLCNPDIHIKLDYAFLALYYVTRERERKKEGEKKEQHSPHSYHFSECG